MSENTEYRTKQREAILSFLKNSNATHLTIDDVTDYMKLQGEKVGRTTIYRYMEKLANQGILRKYFIEEGAGACYQYVDGGEQCHEHYHLKCLKCSRLLHIECDFLSGLEKHILEHHMFQVDNTKTVFYGLCCECSKNNSKKP